MGFVFSKLYRFLFGDKNIKILILGLDNAGKTTILLQLKLGKIVETVPSKFKIFLIKNTIYFFKILFSFKIFFIKQLDSTWNQ